MVCVCFICYTTPWNCKRASLLARIFTHDLKQTSPACALVYMAIWADDLLCSETHPLRAVAEKSLHCISNHLRHFIGSANKWYTRNLNFNFF